MIPRRRSNYVWILFAVAASSAQALDNGVAQSPSVQEYWAQFERKDWNQAILAAEKLVDTARMNAVTAPLDLADVLTLLGSAHLANRNYVAAEAAFSESLQIVEPRVVATSDKLLEPLRGLGYTLSYAGKYETAVPVLERALVVSRRANGLFNFTQQGLLRQLAMCLVKTGDYMGAAQQMTYLMRVGQHTYGADDPRMAGVYDAIGDFYLQAGLVGTGREAYLDGLRVVERKLGRNHLATVEPLRSYAESYRRELFLAYFNLKLSPEQRTQLADNNQLEAKALNPRFLSSDGERALKRALKTLDAHPERSTTQLFDVLLDLGDWYTIKTQPELALPYYRRAAGLLSQMEPTQSEVARAKISFPAQIYYPVPMLATRNLDRPDETVDERFVHVVFTVKEDGTVDDETVLEQHASSRQTAETLAAIRAARYRPKLTDGEPVATADVSVRQVFRQRKETE